MINSVNYPALVSQVLKFEPRGGGGAADDNQSAMALIEKLGRLDDEPLQALLELAMVAVGEGSHPEHVEDVVRELDREASSVAAYVQENLGLVDGYASRRKKHPNPKHDENRFRYLWTLARLLEWAGERSLGLCSFCHRSVEDRRDGKPMLYCIKHAPTENGENKGGYQRGRKHAQDFQILYRAWAGRENDDANTSGSEIDRLTLEVLGLHMRAARNGGGSAFWALREVLRKEDESYDFSHLIPEHDLGLALLQAPTGSEWSSFTELAKAVREQIDDTRGLDHMKTTHGTATPLSIAEQWIRYAAWLHAGDSKARVGKGRPSEIDREKAMEMKANLVTNQEIARTFKVSVHAVNAFFAKMRKQGESIPRTRGRPSNLDDA